MIDVTPVVTVLLESAYPGCIPAETSSRSFWPVHLVTILAMDISFVRVVPGLSSKFLHVQFCGDNVLCSYPFIYACCTFAKNVSDKLTLEQHGPLYFWRVL